jgi:hypothetical protein
VLIRLSPEQTGQYYVTAAICGEKTALLWKRYGNAIPQNIRKDIEKRGMICGDETLERIFIHEQ